MFLKNRVVHHLILPVSSPFVNKPGRNPTMGRGRPTPGRPNVPPLQVQCKIRDAPVGAGHRPARNRKDSDAPYVGVVLRATLALRLSPQQRFFCHGRPTPGRPTFPAPTIGAGKTRAGQWWRPYGGCGGKPAAPVSRCGGAVIYGVRKPTAGYQPGPAVSAPSPVRPRRAAASWRILYLRILPAAFMGKLSTNSIYRGTLCRAILALI